MADTHQEPVVAPLVHDTKSETPLTTSTEPATDSTTAAPSGTESAKEPVLGATDNVSPDATEPSASATDATPTASVTSGYLSYKAPGLLKSLFATKKYFWLGDEPIDHANLTSYIRTEKPEVAHHNAAWSTKTGKGLLYVAKSESDKHSPQDIINLADATQVEKSTPHEFSFKVLAQKYTFKATSDVERDAWVVSVEQAITLAKENRDDIVNHEHYKNTMSHLNKPAAVAGAALAGGSTAAATKEPVEEPTAAATTSGTSPAAGTSAASPTGDKADQPRSSSRGKRASIFGAIKNKVEDLESGRKLKKDERTEVKDKNATLPAHEPAVVVGGAEKLDGHAIAERVLAAEPVDDSAAAAPVLKTSPATAEPLETKDRAVSSPVNIAPKPSKRNSLLGNLYQKVRSPTSEKKESEVLPQVPAKDEPVSPVVPQLPEPGHTSLSADNVSPPADAANVPAQEAAAGATPVESPSVEPRSKKDRESFFGSLMNKARAKSPAAGHHQTTSPSTNEPAVKPEIATSEAPPVPAKDNVPALDGTKEAEDTVPAETADESAPTSDNAAKTALPSTIPKENRRRSYFGTFGGAKKEGVAEEKTPSKFGSIFRRPSQAQREALIKEPKKDSAALSSAPEVAAEEKPAPVLADEKTAIEGGTEKTQTQPQLTNATESQEINETVPPHKETTPVVAATA